MRLAQMTNGTLCQWQYRSLAPFQPFEVVKDTNVEGDEGRLAGGIAMEVRNIKFAENATAYAPHEVECRHKVWSSNFEYCSQKCAFCTAKKAKKT